MKRKRLIATRREQRRALVVVCQRDAIQTVNNQTNDCLDVTGRRGMPQWATAVNVNRHLSWDAVPGATGSAWHRSVFALLVLLGHCSALGGHGWFEVLRLMRITKKTCLIYNDKHVNTYFESGWLVGFTNYLLVTNNLAFERQTRMITSVT